MPTRPRRRPAGRVHAGFSDSLAYEAIALAIVAAITVLLWLFAIPRIGETTGLRPNRPGLVAASAQVVSCPGGVDLAEACVVSYVTEAGVQGTGPLMRTGLFDVSEGEQLPVFVDPGGRAVVSGWRPVVDAVLLTALACTFTVFSINRWRRVLDYDDAPYDGREPAPRR